MIDSGLFISIFLILIISASLLACIPFFISDQLYLRKRRKQRRLDD